MDSSEPPDPRRQPRRLDGADRTLQGVRQGQPGARSVKLPELKINTVDLKYSETQYNLETGKYYWWPISCDGEEEDIAVLAPELFSNSWINQIVSGEDNINEVHTQAIYSVEFDGPGAVIISFIPIRPGQYDFYTPGYENKGLKGQFLVE